MTEYISVAQMATKLNISRELAYDLIHAEGFPLTKLGRIVRIPVDKLEKWLEKRTGEHYA
ncbi:MAG: helix-turn-helix domain-containing protein [Bacillota bacterium]|nr:helix-turn-helix domain-containing protein [Bacillota bacterium]